MGKVIIFLIVIVFAFQGAAGPGLSVAQQQSSEKPSTDPGRAIKVTITTGGGLFGPAKDRYK